MPRAQQVLRGLIPLPSFLPWTRGAVPLCLQVRIIPGIAPARYCEGLLALAAAHYDAMFQPTLRGCRDANGQPIFQPAQDIGQIFKTGLIDGFPVLYPRSGAIDSAQGLGFCGQKSELVYAMRQDISFTVAAEAVIQDAGGNIVYNLFQQDIVALRMVFRLGFALPNPINRLQADAGSRSPFAILTA